MNRILVHSLLAAILGAANAHGQTTERISESPIGLEGTGLSERPVISENGRFTAFVSTAPEFVPGDTNGLNDVFVRNNETGSVVRVSVGPLGLEANGKSDRPSISADGRFVAFYSDAWNLVVGDLQTFDVDSCPTCPGLRDIFVHDRDPDGNGIFDEANGLTTRVSLSSTGTPANEFSTRPALSGDGRYVAYRSTATNLVTNITDGERHIYIYDRNSGITVVADTNLFGEVADDRSDRPSLSGDGRFIAYQSDASNLTESSDGTRSIYIHDRDGDGNGVFDDTSPLVSMVSKSSLGIPGDDASISPSVSSDGRFIEFSSVAANLVVGDTNDASDEFVHDQDFGTTVRVSVSAEGVGTSPIGPGSDRSSLSADGRYISFVSEADDLGFVDTNNNSDVFVRDRLAGSVTRISIPSTGTGEANDDSDRPSISADGRIVAFYSDAWNLVLGDGQPYDPTNCPSCTGVRDIFVHDRDPDSNGIFDEGNSTVVRVSVSSLGIAGNGTSTRPRVSADGRFVSFVSNSTNLSPEAFNGLDQIYVHDLLLGTTTLMSVGETGFAGDHESDHPALSDDGRFVTFTSKASNLVVGDTPTFDPDICPSCTGSQDIFVRDRDPDGNGIFDEPGSMTTRVNISTLGIPGDQTSGRPDISSDGRHIVFHSEATNLVPSDINLHTDVFVHDRFTGDTTRLSVSPAGQGGTYGSDRPRISGDGRFVAFRAKADNLAPGDEPAYDGLDCSTCTGVRDIMVRDRDPDANGIFDEGNGVTTRHSLSTGGTPANRDVNGVRISRNGFTVSYDSTSSVLVGGDTNNTEDVFVSELLTGATSRVSVDPLGGQLDTPTTATSSSGGRISADGRFVVYQSTGRSLVANDSNDEMDVFLHDRDSDENGIFDELGSISTSIISISTDGGQGNQPSTDPSVSADGSRVAYTSLASDLVSFDTNSVEDVFLRTLEIPCTVDFNDDGVLNFFDVSVFLSMYSAGDLTVDLTGDGILNFFDVSSFLSEFAAGCP